MKIKIIVTAIIALVVVLGAIVFARFDNTKKTAPVSASSSSARMSMEGVRFYGMNQGRRVIAIAADRFVIRRGRIGFFNVGLTRMAKFENARIDIYATTGEATAAKTVDGQLSDSERIPLSPKDVRSRGQSSSPEAAVSRNRPAPFPEGAWPSKPPARLSDPPPLPVPGIIARQELHSKPPVVSSEKPAFDDIFQEATFSSLLPVKNIAAIEASPVIVTLHGEKGVMTTIAAFRASVRMKEQAIFFSGGVHVSSGTSELETEELTFSPRTARLTTDQPWTFSFLDRTFRGTGFSSDVFLKR